MYIVEFYNKTDRFAGDHILLNNGLMYEINVTRTYLDNPPQPKEKKFDSLVGPTLTAILTDFIRTGGIMPVYFFVCETGDEKEAARRKLFSDRWYLRSSLNGWCLYNYELRENEDDQAPWFLGLLIHQHHPLATEFPLAFEKFIRCDAVQGKMITTTRTEMKEG